MIKPGVLLVGNFLSSHTGTRTVCEDLSLYLSKAGWRTIETSHRYARLPRLLDMLFTTVRHRKLYAVAYVEVYSGLAFLWAELVLRLLNILHKPTVLALHGGGLLQFAQDHPARVAGLLKKARAVVTPSRFLQEGLGVLGFNIRHLPNAINVRDYDFRMREAPSPRIIWLRAFHEIYQPELAVAAVSHLAGEIENIHLTMIGPDKKDGSLARTVELMDRSGLDSHIDIAGPVSKAQVAGRLAQGDIFLNTTRFESFGISVMEAAACGLPIVTTDVGELGYLWKDGEDALLVPADSSERVAQAIHRILHEPGLSARLSQNARRKAEEYDWGIILPRWEALFDELAR